MAESAVKILIMSIEFMLNHPGYVIGGVRHEISKVKLELESIGSFIKDAEKCKSQNEGVTVWVVQVRDVAFEAEDVIDEFSYHVDSMKKGGFGGRLAGVFYFPKVIWLRYKTALELKRIRGEIKDIAKRSKRYDLSHMEASSTVGSNSHNSSSCVQNIGESSLFIKNDEIVGIDHVRDSLLSRLEGQEAHRIVISVVGMGGSGKSTLVAKAYTSLTVRQKFDCCAWVSVPQNSTIEDLLKKLISEFLDGEENMIPNPAFNQLPPDLQPPNPAFNQLSSPPNPAFNQLSSSPPAVQSPQPGIQSAAARSPAAKLGSNRPRPRLHPPRRRPQPQPQAKSDWRLAQNVATSLQHLLW